MAMPVVAERKRLTLTEFGPGVVANLALDEISSLEASAERWRRRLGLPSTPLVVTSLEGTTRIAARHVTGVLRVGGIDFEIVPKFLGQQSVPGSSWKDALWRILSLVDNAAPSDELTSALPTQNLSLVDLLADVFVSGFRKGAARGLPRTYREDRSLEPVVRGSIDLGRMGDWLARPWLVPCVVDSLTEDTDAARLIRWAASELSSTVSSSRRSQNLRDIVHSMAGVGVRPPSVATATAIRLGSQYQALQQVVGLASLLLEGRGLEHATGPAEMGGFLWNSDEVYERFLFYLCQRAARQLAYQAEKRSLRMGEPATPATRPLTTTPDVLIRQPGSGVVAVIDAKYKVFGRTPKASDSYQIVTAAHTTGCRWVALAYPDSGGGAAKSWSVTSHLGGGAVALTALPLDLLRASTQVGTTALVAELAAWIKQGPT
jgi:5-methylcytosine-specific restriction enzyme subunit McrC